MGWTIAINAAVFAFNSLGYCCEICVPIQSANPGCLIKQQMVKYCTPAILSQNSLLIDAALIITNLVETAIPCSHYLNMWCNNCSLIGFRMESHPSHIHFAFLSSFSWILTVSLFQMMNCLWWRLVAQQVAWTLRLPTSICCWICCTFSYKVNRHLFSSCLLSSTLGISASSSASDSSYSSSSSSSTGLKQPHITPIVLYNLNRSSINLLFLLSDSCCEWFNEHYMATYWV